ncbi:hypothetical protein [Parasitella parasitica]|uniref:Glycosyltransferase subfamily 4-like N-terminal domain-containing protein n=1 Tax=Parasitella parasitica TaxID=35722 RepID=A0A0B7NKJ7_9FUNG|nr:hypothetical protein [Parasitella parasitica]
MRIAIITENFLPKVDGVTRTLARLLEHLSKTDYRVIVLGPETNMATYAGADLVGTYGIPFFLYPELKFNFWRPKFTQKLMEFQPDVIHLVDPVFLGAFGLAVVRYYLPDVPIVSSYHTNLAVYCDHFGYGFLKSIMWRWNRYCHSFSRFIACPSPSTLSVLRNHGFENIKLWPRGVDISLFSPAKRSENLRAQWLGLSPLASKKKTVIIYVGRISFEKNISLVVEAYKDMDHSSCHLVLVGHGPAFYEIQRYCSSSCIPVTFTGYLQGQDLSRAYASADIFAFPSVTETFGQVVLEAMSSGLPVVGLDAEGVRDLVDDKCTGLLLKTTNLSVKDQKNKYRELLETLVTQPHLLDLLSCEAVRKAKKYTWSEAMQRMVNVYHDATGCSDEELPRSLKLCLGDDREEGPHQKDRLLKIEPSESSSSNALTYQHDDSGDSGVEEDYAFHDEESKLLQSCTTPVLTHTQIPSACNGSLLIKDQKCASQNMHYTIQ